MPQNPQRRTDLVELNQRTPDVRVRDAIRLVQSQLSPDFRDPFSRRLGAFEQRGQHVRITVGVVHGGSVAT